MLMNLLFTLNFILQVGLGDKNSTKDYGAEERKSYLARTSTHPFWSLLNFVQSILTDLQVFGNNIAEIFLSEIRGDHADSPPAQDRLGEEIRPTLIPRKEIFADPDYANLLMSRDGRWLSWLSFTDGTANLFVRKLPSGSPKQLTNETNQGIDLYYWAADSRTILYWQDKNGDERLSSIDVISKVTKLLFGAKNVKAELFRISLKQPTKVVIGLNNRDPRYYDVYELDLITGDKRLIFHNDRYQQFIIDDQLKIRFMMEETDDGGKTYYEYRRQRRKIGDYPIFKKFHLNDSIACFPLAFDKTNTKIYWKDYVDDEEDFASLYLIDIDTKNRTLLYKARKRAISRVAFHHVELVPLFLLLDYDKSERIVFDDEIADQIKIMIEKLAELEPDYHKKWDDITIVDYSVDLNQWIFVPDSDQQPPRYYLYNRTSQSVQFAFSSLRALEKYTFAPMIPVEIPVADQLTQLCYLTLPRESNPNGSRRPSYPLPLILLVHGGPWMRDYWGFDVISQFFANRGYATMQCNFRMSTGFGKRFYTAGFGEWAGKMQTDLSDAVNWAIDNEIARRDKVAIVGESYGGYAVLAALTMSPDFYACGIEAMGPSNLETFLESIPATWKPMFNKLQLRIGVNISTPDGRAKMRAISPINFVHRINKPLLVAHGLNDPRVNANETLQIIEALHEANLSFTAMLFRNEGHGFTLSKNYLAFYAEVEQFLAKCLGGRSEPFDEKHDKSDDAIIYRF